MNMTIEKGIPVPRRGRYITIAQEMDIGDSVFCKDRSQANAVAAVIRSLGFNAVTRKIENGYRVWKTKL